MRQRDFVFVALLFSPNMMILSHPCCYKWQDFSILYGLSNIHCICISIFFIHSLMNEHLICSYFLAIVYNGAVIWECRCLSWQMQFISIISLLRSGTAGWWEAGAGWGWSLESGSSSRYCPWMAGTFILQPSSAVSQHSHHGAELKEE